MVELNLQRLASARPVPGPQDRKPLGLVLLERGIISSAQLAHALRLQAEQNAPLGETLVGEGWASRQDVLTALSEQSGWQVADFDTTPPTRDICSIRPVSFWLDHNVIPWLRMGPLLLVATAKPDTFDQVVDRLSDTGMTIVPVLAGPEQIDEAIAATYGLPLARSAEARVVAEQSCRNWAGNTQTRPIAIAGAVAAVLIATPAFGIAILFWCAIATLMLFLSLRVLGLVMHVFRQNDPTLTKPPTIERFPRISVMVPLYKEREIADVLIKRLQRLTYPKALLDVALVLEEQDSVTRDALETVALPSWIRAVVVPKLGKLTTKPRAMNYALDFCRGEIIGVWDAEDAPIPDQLETVALHFAKADETVVCLQGALDYYNPRTNWRSRCFTIEYNGWFRVVLPGIARLGLVVPLGGTTFFFRRDKLLELGGWDAHNVTEDADLGVRLSRAGYRTEIVNTTTFEEANFRAWPWVKQRSRWLKGFTVTYLVHMRAPGRLLVDLGLKRFLGVQAFFLGTLGQFLLAPVLWLFWLSALGFTHPFEQVASPEILTLCFALFVAAEGIGIMVGMFGVAAGNKRHLIPWVPTMALYYPLGVLAAYKALWELVVDPFYWDKTQHGQAEEEPEPEAEPE